MSSRAIPFARDADTPGMRPSRPILAALASVRAFLAAFLGSLGWFIWAATQQTSSSCYDDSHYVPSAVVALVTLVALTVASRRPWREQSVSLLVGQGVATTVWTAFGLSIAIFFAAAIGCSA